MNGKDFIANTTLFGRINHDPNESLEIKAAVDQTCENVDPNSLPHLLELGDIRPKPKKGKAVVDGQV